MIVGIKKLIPILVCTLLAAGAPTVSAAQQSEQEAVHPMLFNRIAVDQGLSQSNVLSILQDSSGMMWFGTEDGLNRYDGYEFEHFQRERGNPAALANDFIFDIVEDASNNLWLATNGGGIARFDRASGEFTMFRHDPDNANSLASNLVRRLVIDGDGIIWAATRGAGLTRFDPLANSFRHYRLNGDSTQPDKIYALHIDAENNLWVGGDHGLTRIDTHSDQLTTFVNDPGNANSISAGSVRAITADAQGTLWVGTYGGGLNRMQANGQHFDRFAHDGADTASLSGDQVTSIFEDADGRLWVGTTNGLNLVDKRDGKAVRFSNDSSDVNSLSDNNITTIYQDRAGLLWVGTKMRGVNTWNPRTWGFGFEPAEQITADGQSAPNVTSFVEDTSGKLWVGTFGDGLNALDRNTGELVKFRSDDSGDHALSDDRVMSLMRDRDGMIWVGTMTQGVSRLDPATGVTDTFKHDPDNANSLSANGIMSLFEDRAGRVWIGTFGGGISVYDRAKKTFQRFAADGQPGSLSSNRITSFAQDTTGMMWIGTDAGGLNLFDPVAGTFHAFRHDPGLMGTLADDTVYDITVDNRGTVWVGTRGGGLDKVVGDVRDPDTVSFQNLSQIDGLSNDTVYGVQFDDSGWLWMSTNYGISRYNPTTGKLRNIHRKDGLQSEEFNFGAHYRSESGELFFGGHNGYNAFHPSAIQRNAVAPLIALTGFFHGNDPVKADLPTDEDGNVDVSWKNNNVSFEFAALDYTSSKDNRYQYKLEGFDKDWIDLGTRRRVTYTDLDDGSYLLRVKAANSDGTWNEAGFALPVRVAAAPWETWWAYAGYIALALNLVLGLFLGHRRKIRREEAYSRRLEREVRARTEQLASNNDELKELNNALQKSSLSDPLTGLRNRRFVFEEVSRDLEVIQGKLQEQHEGTYASDTADLVFMMIDMDNFKPINDTYGHAAGDKMLLELRDVLLGICRRSDFVVRWGGDEFVVIAKQSRPRDSEALAERIRSTIESHHFEIGDGQIARTTCSIGFVGYPMFRARPDESNLDQMINIADGLMYEAKKQRNAWVGMHGPEQAVTSENFDHESIESTSLLFRARHARKLSRHGVHASDAKTVRRLTVVG